MYESGMVTYGEEKYMHAWVMSLLKARGSLQTAIYVKNILK